MKLTAADLRNLAAALDNYTIQYRAHRVLPGCYDTGLQYTTEAGDDINLRVSVSNDGDTDRLIIDDKYGD